jgi:hypothetical protein
VLRNNYAIPFQILIFIKGLTDLVVKIFLINKNWVSVKWQQINLSKISTSHYSAGYIEEANDYS